MYAPTCSSQGPLQDKVLHDLLERELRLHLILLQGVPLILKLVLELRDHVDLSSGTVRDVLLLKPRNPVGLPRTHNRF